MSTAQTRQVVEGFLDSMAGRWLAEDVELHDLARSRHHRGRDEVSGWFHRRQGEPNWPSLIIDDGRAAVEVELRELPDAAPVPTALIVEVWAGEITVARLYILRVT